MGRYGNNIRRIAQTDELLDQIRAAEQKLTLLEKAAIPGARAIAYADGSTQTGSPGSTAPDKNGSPDSSGLFPNKDEIFSGGVDGGSTNGDDLINGDVQLKPGEDPGSLELKDCETGEQIDVRFNTGANPGEAKFKHPEGWEVDGPGVDSSYLAGSVWALTSGVTTYFSNTFNGVVEEFKGTAPWSYCYTIEGGLVSKLTPSAGDALIQFTNTARTVGQAPVGGVQFAYTTNLTVAGSQYGRILCGAMAGDTTACAASPPEAFGSWQDDVPGTPHQLAFSAADGGFVSSAYDTTIPSKYSNLAGSGKGLNNLNLCTPSGEQVVVSALSDGSFAYFKEDGFGLPETDAKIFHFDSSGKYKDLIRADEYNYLKSTG